LMFHSTFSMGFGFDLHKRDNILGCEITRAGSGAR
jgi:hypothetical protein